MEEMEMKSFCHAAKYIKFATLLAIFLFAFVLPGFSQKVYAEEHSHKGFAGEHGPGGGKLDSRYGHNHYYPVRGSYVHALPRGNRVFVRGGIRYYFSGGVWYRAYGPRFMIVGPPVGLIIPFLPPFYATIWVGGVPYYYANEAYYVQTPGGYMVVDEPAGEVSQNPPSSGVTPPQAEKMFIYPRSNQSEKQQAEDRYQCHTWAVSQTNYDPTQPPGGTPSAQKDTEYRRAMSACLDARGYTVK